MLKYVTKKYGDIGSKNWE